MEAHLRVNALQRRWSWLAVGPCKYDVALIVYFREASPQSRPARVEWSSRAQIVELGGTLGQHFSRAVPKSLRPVLVKRRTPTCFGDCRSTENTRFLIFGGLPRIQPSSRNLPKILGYTGFLVRKILPQTLEVPFCCYCTSVLCLQSWVGTPFGVMLLLTKGIPFCWPFGGVVLWLYCFHFLRSWYSFTRLKQNQPSSRLFHSYHMLTGAKGMG